uniref:Secreted protein n=1 Tax=Cacopsylla melanoneura TaxID=428564 RepID=A0A8D9DXU5_9HEMI
MFLLFSSITFSSSSLIRFSWSDTVTSTLLTLPTSGAICSVMCVHRDWVTSCLRLRVNSSLRLFVRFPWNCCINISISVLSIFSVLGNMYLLLWKTINRS